MRTTRKFWFIFLIVFLFSFKAFAFTFVVFGDNRDGDKIFQDLIAKINQEKNVSFALSLGDFVSYGKEDQYLAYRKLIANLKFPVYHVPGNHDLIGNGERYFKKYFGPLYYSFDYEGAHFTIINNAFRSYFDHTQFEWLKNDLSTTKMPIKFVFMHRPTFDPSELYKSHVMSGRKVVEELMQIFERNKVNYVFAGHIHGYAKAERNGVVYIVSGGAGSPLHLPPAFGGFYHYLKIKVENGKIQDQVVKVYE